MQLDYMYHKLCCSKCGRKILVEITLVGVSHNAGIYVTCAGCLGEIGEQFKAEQSAAALDIENWIKEK